MSAPRSANMPNGGVKRISDYALTIDMAKELCMMSHTKLGKKYRRYFIDLERKWNDPQEVVKRGYAILQNENAKLKIENEEMKPKALLLAILFIFLFTFTNNSSYVSPLRGFPLPFGEYTYLPVSGLGLSPPSLS